jgi:hypothetical protein
MGLSVPLANLSKNSRTRKVFEPESQFCAGVRPAPSAGIFGVITKAWLCFVPRLE